MWISLANFCFLWPTMMVSFVCDLRLYNVFDATTFIDIRSSTLLTVETLLSGILFQITFFNAMVIVLNTFVCIDLIMTFRSPFKKPDSRYT